LCKACPLHTHVHNRVLYRGPLPCDVLFIGNAPGEIEDTIGEPFVGPAGEMLEMLIAEVKERLGIDFTSAFTNTVACLPCDVREGGRTIRPPKISTEVKTCSGHVNRLLEYANPKYIVFVGKVAESASKFYGIKGYGMQKANEQAQLALFPSSIRYKASAAIEHPTSIANKEKVAERQAAMDRAVIELELLLGVPF
jgi:uracil-DNA glycosylase family 4